MTSQVAVLAGLVVAMFAWISLPRLRPLLRLIPVAALALAVALTFTRIDLPPFAMSFLFGAGLSAALMGLFWR